MTLAQRKNGQVKFTDNTQLGFTFNTKDNENIMNKTGWL